MAEDEWEEWEKCVHCKSSRCAPGWFGSCDGKFAIDPNIAKRRKLLSIFHVVELEQLAWLCLDCGTAWQATKPDSLQELRTALQEKCLPQFRERLFGEYRGKENPDS